MAILPADPQSHSEDTAMLYDRVKRMTSLALELPAHVEKITVIIEQKTAAEAQALKREAAAIEKAVTPELEAEIEKLEGLLAHIPGLEALIKANDVAAPVAAEPAAAAAPLVNTAESLTLDEMRDRVATLQAGGVTVA